jgi:hypothetical protein
MKQAFAICTLAVALAVFTAGCKSDFSKLPESDMDPAMKASAESLATRMLTAWRDGQYAPLGEEATAAMRSGLSPERQEQAYEQFKGMFGDFESLEYVETLVPTDGSSLFIFRFKGKFSKTEATPEVRIVLDGEQKLSGFWVKPWNNSMR